MNEILAEIGDDKLTSDRLFYRIYLTSVQDGGAIVPGISSTGFFGIKGLDHPVENVESVSYTHLPEIYLSKVQDLFDKNGKIIEKTKIFLEKAVKSFVEHVDMIKN